MRESSFDGVFKIVDVVASGFAAIAVIDPGMCVLMHEQRHANGCEIGVAFIAIAVAP